MTYHEIQKRRRHGRTRRQRKLERAANARMWLRTYDLDSAVFDEYIRRCVEARS